MRSSVELQKNESASRVCVRIHILMIFAANCSLLFRDFHYGYRVVGELSKKVFVIVVNNSGIRTCHDIIIQDTVLVQAIQSLLPFSSHLLHQPTSQVVIIKHFLDDFMRPNKILIYNK